MLATPGHLVHQRTALPSFGPSLVPQHIRVRPFSLRCSSPLITRHSSLPLCFQPLTHSIFSNSCAFKRLRIPGGRGTPISRSFQIMTFQTHHRRTNPLACANEPCPGGWRVASAPGRKRAGAQPAAVAQPLLAVRHQPARRSLGEGGSPIIGARISGGARPSRPDFSVGNPDSIGTSHRIHKPFRMHVYVMYRGVGAPGRSGLTPAANSGLYRTPFQDER